MSPATKLKMMSVLMALAHFVWSTVNWPVMLCPHKDQIFLFYFMITLSFCLAILPRYIMSFLYIYYCHDFMSTNTGQIFYVLRRTAPLLNQRNFKYYSLMAKIVVCIPFDQRKLTILYKVCNQT